MSAPPSARATGAVYRPVLKHGIITTKPTPYALRPRQFQGT
jgi:hypothetical protein